MNLKKLLPHYLIFTLIIINSFSSFSQSVTTTVYWTGGHAAGACVSLTCNGLDYQCSNNVWGGWNNGNLTFNDPIPSGRYVTSVDITVYQSDCSPSNVAISLNGYQIGSYSAIYNGCACGDTCRIYSIPTFRGTPPNYNYGGSNTINFNVTSGIICGRMAEITFGYTQCNPTSFSTISPATIWTGANGSYWNYAANWTNGAPTASINAYVPNCGINNPWIRDQSNCRTVTIFSDNGALVSWDPGSTAILNVQGQF